MWPSLSKLKFLSKIYILVKIDIFVQIDISVKFYICVKLSHFKLLTILSIAFDISLSTFDIYINN